LAHSSPVTIPQVVAANDNVFSVNLPGKITSGVLMGGGFKPSSPALWHFLKARCYTDCTTCCVWLSLFVRAIGRLSAMFLLADSLLYIQEDTFFPVSERLQLLLGGASCSCLRPSPKVSFFGKKEADTNKPLGKTERADQIQWLASDGK
jgi:hypothetical protein